jgi:hypothetical protein
MTNRRGGSLGPGFLLLLAAGSLWVLWGVLRRPFGLAVEADAGAGSTVPLGTNAATDPATPGNAGDNVLQAAAVLDGDATAPVWIPDDSEAGGHWALAGDVAGSLLAYRETGDRSGLAAPTTDAGASSAGDAPAGFVKADDYQSPAGDDWREAEAARVLL